MSSRAAGAHPVLKSSMMMNPSAARKRRKRQDVAVSPASPARALCAVPAAASAPAAYAAPVAVVVAAAARAPVGPSDPSPSPSSYNTRPTHPPAASASTNPFPSKSPRLLPLPLFSSELAAPAPKSCSFDLPRAIDRAQTHRGSYYTPPSSSLPPDAPAMMPKMKKWISRSAAVASPKARATKIFRQKN